MVRIKNRYFLAEIEFEGELKNGLEINNFHLLNAIKESIQTLYGNERKDHHCLKGL